MAFLTDRKRAVGMGAAKTGTSNFWNMTVSSAALLILVPFFIFIVGNAIGKPHADVVATFSRPFPALVVALTMLIGFMHFKIGVQTLVEDYVHGLARKITIIVTTCIAYAGAAAALYAIVRIAL